MEKFWKFSTYNHLPCYGLDVAYLPEWTFDRKRNLSTSSNLNSNPNLNPNPNSNRNLNPNPNANPKPSSTKTLS